MAAAKKPKRVPRDSKSAAAGKLDRTERKDEKIFEPTAQQPTDPNAVATKKPGRGISPQALQSLMVTARAGGPGSSMDGHMPLSWYGSMIGRRW